MVFIGTIVVVFVLLMVSELWWRKHQSHGEFSRKFVHITVGSFVAFWPYFLDANQIKLLSLAFLIVVGVSKRLDFFQAVHSIQRPTLGEFWFALVVGLLAFDSGHPHVYTAALLVMSLADGLAAVIGLRYGKRYHYTIFGSYKTLAGTLTFFVTSYVILAVYSTITFNLTFSPLILLITLTATFLENIAIRGLDNLVVPLFVAGALTLIT